MNRYIPSVVIAVAMGLTSVPLWADDAQSPTPTQARSVLRATIDEGVSPPVQPVLHYHYYARRWPYGGHYVHPYRFDDGFHVDQPYYYGPAWRHDYWHRHYYGPPRIGYYDDAFGHGGVRVGLVRVWW